MDENKAKCHRCGFVWTVNTPKADRADLLCFSCRAKKTTLITYGQLRCIPWHGVFHPETDAPMLNGVLFMPGERTCGHTDCVAKQHIVSDNE